MKEKNPQEKMAAERQADLFTNAFEKAKGNGGVWLDNDGRKAPALYQKPTQVSAFNAVILGMHADQNGYKTNQYTLFTDAKKRGESVLGKEKGVPFLWYNWNEYANNDNPEDKISRDAYKALPPGQQSDYKVVRTREVRTLFNIDQTSLPHVNEAEYAAAIKETGRIGDRPDVEAASKAIREGVNELLAKARENLVEIRTDNTGVAHYDAKKDIAYLPNESSYEDFKDYARDAVTMVLEATGHPGALPARELQCLDPNLPPRMRRNRNGSSWKWPPPPNSRNWASPPSFPLKA